MGSRSSSRGGPRHFVFPLAGTPVAIEPIPHTNENENDSPAHSSNSHHAARKLHLGERFHGYYPG